MTPTACWSRRAALATKRVVVKRPDYAPPLADVPAHAATLTKSHRFDIYMPL